MLRIPCGTLKCVCYWVIDNIYVKGQETVICYAPVQVKGAKILREVLCCNIFNACSNSLGAGKEQFSTFHRNLAIYEWK